MTKGGKLSMNKDGSGWIDLTGAVTNISFGASIHESEYFGNWKWTTPKAQAYTFAIEHIDSTMMKLIHGNTPVEKEEFIPDENCLF